ncbi:MAG: response regulator [Spartobacteria bacterium]|nr:response regulator [Spartobacteria bacterium]
MVPALDITFLVIDDSVSMRRVIQIMLKRCGIAGVEFASGGKQAVEMIKKKRYDAVFCDWNMPDLCGLDVVRFARTLPLYKHVPIIMCTSERFKREVVSAVAAGATEYIVKPFQIDTFRRKLASMLKEPYPAFSAFLLTRAEQQVHEDTSEQDIEHK